MKYTSMVLAVTDPNAVEKNKNTMQAALEKACKEKVNMIYMFDETQCLLSKIVKPAQVEDPVIIASGEKSLLDISPDKANPKHQVLARLLKIKTIPKYMEHALGKAEVNKRYAKTIQLPKYGNCNWDQVKNCLGGIFIMGNIRSKIRGQMYIVQSKPEEAADVYADHIEEKVKNQFKGIKNIKSVTSLLNLLRTCPTLMEGQALDMFGWYISKYGKSKYMVPAGDNDKSHIKAGLATGQTHQGTGQKCKRNSDCGSAKNKQACTESYLQKPTVKPEGSCKNHLSTVTKKGQQRNHNISPATSFSPDAVHFVIRETFPSKTVIHKAIAQLGKVKEITMVMIPSPNRPTQVYETCFLDEEAWGKAPKEGIKYSHNDNDF
ncbi:hypothetical protein BGZ76_011686 [Entomortierella beljakovae]|nr:hypothetical protein BGZ76_011686 [Entomortierella beljakovae]